MSASVCAARATFIAPLSSAASRKRPPAATTTATRAQSSRRGRHDTANHARLQRRTPLRATPGAPRGNIGGGMSAASSRDAAAAVAAGAGAVPPSSASTVLALDFDGVVCDSEPESSISGWKHGEQLWPDVFGAHSADDAIKTRVLGDLKAVRPVVETGFENTLLARALLEELHSVEDIIADWARLMVGSRAPLLNVGCRTRYFI